MQRSYKEYVIVYILIVIWIVLRLRLCVHMFFCSLTYRKLMCTVHSTQPVIWAALT